MLPYGVWVGQHNTMLWQWANTGVRVYILDLDGTLIPSNEIDDQCFWQAVFECFDQETALPDIHEFKHVTDSGILREWCFRELDRMPGKDEVDRVRRLFLGFLEQASKKSQDCFEPLPGVEDWLEAVGTDHRIHAAIATGGWGHSARFKLKQSELDRFGLSLTSSDDATTRAEIMNIAAKRITEPMDQVQPAITYVGDGLWDLKASDTLRWEFIGIASGHQARMLKNAGATCVLRNFTKRKC